VSKDKKKKNKSGAKARKAVKGLKAASRNPLVADVVATALVATAAALKDSRKARQLAEQAGDELQALAAGGAERGNAMWQLALDVGRRAIDTLVGDAKGKAAKAPKKSPAKPAKKTTVKAKAPAIKAKAPAIKAKSPAAKAKRPAAKPKAN